jgi:hypothetical protein
MAGVITHLVIAREILKILPEGIIKNPDLFYLGSIAPDAVHAREDYVRAHKKHSHFRDDIPDKDFETPENYKIYQDRLITFINKNKDREDVLIDLYRGYVTHILTDELFVLSIRKEFCETMAKLGIGQGDRPFFDYIVTDMNRNDMLLVFNYEGMEEIRRCMEQVPVYPIEGYISAKEMGDCRNWLIYRHFYEKQEKLEPTYTSYKRNLDFIHTAAGEVIKKLSGESILPTMF